MSSAMTQQSPVAVTTRRADPDGTLAIAAAGTLLVLVARRTELTHAGTMMLPEARATLRQADRAAERARRADRGEIGGLSVGYVRSATFRALPVSLRAFHDR